MNESASTAAALGGPSASPWPRIAIGDVARTSSGTTPSRRRAERYFAGGTVPWVKTLDLRNGEISATDECVTDLAVQETSLQMYPPGTVLVAMYGGFNQIGRTGLLRIPACVNQALSAIQVNRDRVLPEYLLAVLNFRVEHWKAVASSSRKDPNITGNDVRAFELPLPSMDEQRSIAAALADVDALFAKLDQQIVKKRDLQRAVMQQLLAGRTRLAGFSAPWPESSFGELFEFLRNASNSRADLSASGEVGYVHYGDIHLHSSPFIDARRDLLTFIDADKVKSTPPLRDGDVLMADASEDTEAIGKAVEITGLGGLRAVGGLHTLVLRPRPGRLARGFAGYVQFMPAVRTALVRAATGVSVYGVSKSSVRAIVTPLPGVEEQSAIAEFLSDMGAEIVALEARREKTRQLKQGMMQALLTGRIRLV
jgi:type I restriction enzyme S subunit